MTDTNGQIVNQSVLSAMMNQSSMGAETAVSEAVGDAYRYVASPLRFVPPYYGGDREVRDMYYVPLYSQRSSDPVTITKIFDDHNG